MADPERTRPDPFPRGDAAEDQGGGRTSWRPTRDEDGMVRSRCDLCGFEVIDRHCKVVCGNCGYMRDCSDP